MEADLIFDLKSKGNKIAIETVDQRIDYTTAWEYAEEIALSVSERSLVFVIASNTIPSVLGYVGFLDHRIVPLLLEERISSDLCGNLIDIYKPDALWIPREREGEFSGYDKVVLEKDGYTLLVRDGGAPFDRDRGTSVGNAERSTTDPDGGANSVASLDPGALHPDLALLISTSGSTGSPKLVRLSYENILDNTRSIIEYLHIDENEKAITSLPMNYVYGLSVINTHLYSGATLFLTEESPYSAAFWGLMGEKEITSFAGVPFMYEMLSKLGVTDMDLPKLMTLTQAGGKLSPELHKYYAEYAAHTGKHFVVMYGASEATARMGYLPWQQAIAKQGSMGIAIPGGRLELLDADGNEIKESDKVGELVYYGRNVSLGYAQCRKDLSLGNENKGRLETGDMAYKDADGYFFVVGRKKRFVKLLGKRVNLDELERAIKTKFKKIEIACVGKDDELVFVAAEEIDAAAIRTYLLNEIGINKRMIRIESMDEIPKNASGKTLYSVLTERFCKQ